jgi:hemoglobin
MVKQVFLFEKDKCDIVFLWPKRRGHPALRARHAPFAVTTANGNRWVHHMLLALDDVKIVEQPIRQAMEEFFKDVAMFLRNRDDEQ